MDLKGLEWVDINQIHFAWNVDQWWAVVDMVMNLQVL
jgi:hypothetical protein